MNEVDVPALERWLGERLDEGVRVGQLETSKDGFSNDTLFFRATCSGCGGDRALDLVLRRSAERHGLYPVQSGEVDGTIDLQHRVMRALHVNGMRVPDIVGYESDESVLGDPFLVMHRVSGEVPNDHSLVGSPGVLHGATETQRRALVEDTLAQLVRLHALDWRAAGLEWLDRGGDGVDRLDAQLDLWHDYALGHLRGRDHPVLFDALEWLRSNRPPGMPAGFVWGDARLPNTICSPDLQCRALLDWEGAAILPAEVDVGYWLVSDRIVHEVRGADRLAGLPTRDEQIEYYEHLRGRPVDHLGYFEVFAGMRICALMLTTIPRLIERGLHPDTEHGDIHNAYSDFLTELRSEHGVTPAPSASGNG